MEEVNDLSGSTSDSILLSIKKDITGLGADYEYFDEQIIMHINTCIAVLKQLGVGSNGFRITGPNETWDDYLGDDPRLDLVKSYISLRTIIMFDKTLTTYVVNSINDEIDELEWRIYIAEDEILEEQNG